jgi:hypothetical protein
MPGPFHGPKDHVSDIATSLPTTTARSTRMSEFLDLLSIYYTCDAMAAIRPLTRTSSRLHGCLRGRETLLRPRVRACAPAGTADRAEQMRAAYIGFVGWQDANPDLVTQMRTDAAARLGEMPTALR